MDSRIKIIERENPSTNSYIVLVDNKEKKEFPNLHEAVQYSYQIKREMDLERASISDDEQK